MCGDNAIIIVSGCYFGPRVTGTHTGGIFVNRSSSLTVMETLFEGTEAYSGGAVRYDSHFPLPQSFRHTKLISRCGTGRYQCQPFRD